MKVKHVTLSLLITLIGYSLAAAQKADTLVVCPAFLQPHLAPWQTLRREQGHRLLTIEPPRSSAELMEKVRAAARSHQLRYIALIGDVDIVPTAYANAKVNILWGSEPTIATDQLYADVDGDSVPDLAVGRIPVDTPQQLQAVVRKIVQYEASDNNGPNRRQIDVVAGVGGFGIVADSLIEASARSVFTQVVPKNYSVRRLTADPEATCRQISAGSFAWIYLGHGLPTMLDAVPTPQGPRPILQVNDLVGLPHSVNRSIAVLVACYTGAIDAESDALAEALVLHERGPVAAIAATRVTMPYGNSVFGCELLRAAFRDPPGHLGDIWRRAQCQTLLPSEIDDSLRSSLDAIARGVSPQPVDLAAERREHVLLYQLLGDPLLRLNYPGQFSLTTPRMAAAQDDLQSR